jgi:hypothetical protein
MKPSELKKYMKAKGLPIDGNAKQLLARVIAHERAAADDGSGGRVADAASTAVGVVGGAVGGSTTGSSNEPQPPFEGQDSATNRKPAAGARALVVRTEAAGAVVQGLAAELAVMEGRFRRLLHKVALCERAAPPLDNRHLSPQTQSAAPPPPQQQQHQRPPSSPPSASSLPAAAAMNDSAQFLLPLVGHTPFSAAALPNAFSQCELLTSGGMYLVNHTHCTLEVRPEAARHLNTMKGAHRWFHKTHPGVQLPYNSLW